MSKIKGGANIRTATVHGFGTPIDELSIHLPFVLIANPIVQGADARQIVTSPVQSFQVEDMKVTIETENSIYLIDYGITLIPDPNLKNMVLMRFGSKGLMHWDEETLTKIKKS
ncbi:MAG: hypothetical protein EOP06_01110 [Proteobacteria bacterium]|nr:MAG: hypothetical protein EOP06_01110 [Pseudomonadota bacterium]